MPALKTPAVARRGRRRWPLRLGLSLLVLLGLLVGADFAARYSSGRWLAGQVRSATGAAEVSASLGGFPFLPPLVFSGSINSAEVVAKNVPAGLLNLEQVSVDARQIEIDRSLFWKSQVVKPTAIEAALVTVALSPTALSAAIGHQVTLTSGGQVRVDVAGRSLLAEVRLVAGRSLVVSVGGVTVATIDLSGSKLLPACQMSTSVRASLLVFECRLSPVPASLLGELAGYQAAARRGAPSSSPSSLGDRRSLRHPSARMLFAARAADGSGAPSRRAG